MPWDVRTVKECREEFVILAGTEEVNFSRLCRSFGVSRKTGYKWLSREVFEDLSRRPLTSPNKTHDAVEAALLEAALEFPHWGARKLLTVLRSRGVAGLPAPSTAVQILKRNGVQRSYSPAAAPWQRFEHEKPNSLWQMDFKGHFPTGEGRCHPFTVLDDCSRFSLGVKACRCEDTQTAKQALTPIFERYGLPWALLCDNGSPWGSQSEHGLTPLGVWLTKLGIEVWHGRPLHPQTQGKLERFHRTLKLEALQGKAFQSLAACQEAFDSFRHTYNHLRPHESLDMEPPVKKYRPSNRSMPTKTPEPEYPDDCIQRKVFHPGVVNLKGRKLNVPQALIGETVGIREREEVLEVRFFTRIIVNIDLTNHSNV